MVKTAPKTPSTRLTFKEFLRKYVPDLIVALIAVVAIIVLALRVSFDMNEYSDEVGHAIFGTAIAIGLATALIVRRPFAKSIKEAKETGKKRESEAPAGYLYALALPFVALIILTPWLAAGVFNAEGTGTVGTYFLLSLLFAGAVLLGALFLAFVLTPIEVLLRGIFAILQGKREGLPMALGALYLIGITTFIFIMASGVTIDLPGKAGWPAAIAAFFGLPGSYSVDNETLLWVARGIAAVLIGIPVLASIFGKKQKGPAGVAAQDVVSREK
ncbi:MAG: hypothetical protein ACREGE_03200 [Candidatus Microsaccharimonas sp.]